MNKDEGPVCTMPSTSSNNSLSNSPSAASFSNFVDQQSSPVKIEVDDDKMAEERQQQRQHIVVTPPSLMADNVSTNLLSAVAQLQNCPLPPQTAIASPPAVHSPTSSASSSSAEIASSAEFADLAALTCKKCPGGRTFATLDQLNVHCINTHRDRPQYVCSQCGLSFAVKRELATHLRIHAGEQPHRCNQCGKEFGTRQLLKKHYLWHNGERSHVCPECGKAFFQKGHLTQHLQIHSGGRPHHCVLCDKTFIFKFDLNRHLKIHKERGFACKQCGKSFAEQSSLDAHRQTENCRKSSGTRRKSTLASLKNSPPSIDLIAEKMEMDSDQQQSGTEAEEVKPMYQNFSIESQHPTPPNNNSSFDQQMAIGRAFGQLLAAQQQKQQQKPVEQPQYFPCLLCPQKFGNQAAYLLHWSMAHMRSNQNSQSFAQPNPAGLLIPDVETNKPLHIMANLGKNDINVGGALKGLLSHHSDTSCASSPQKVSPICSTSSASSSLSSSAVPEPFSAGLGGLSAFSASDNSVGLGHFPFSCPNCAEERVRWMDCAKELAESRAELDRLRALLCRFGAIFGLLTGQSTPATV